MSVGSLGISGGLAGAPLAQKTGAAADHAKQDAAHGQRRVDSNQRAADASGIGQTQEEHEASDRDADGRMPWERQDAAAHQTVDEPTADNADCAASAPPSSPRDPKGESGGTLDLIA